MEPGENKKHHSKKGYVRQGELSHPKAAYERALQFIRSRGDVLTRREKRIMRKEAREKEVRRARGY